MKTNEEINLAKSKLTKKCAVLPHLSYEIHEFLRRLQINGIFCNFIKRDLDDGTKASKENGFSFFNLIALLYVNPCQSEKRVRKHLPSQSILSLTYIFKKMNLALLKTLINNIRAERFDTPEKTFSSIKEPEASGCFGKFSSGRAIQMKWNETGFRFNHNLPD